jgi:cobaltochelatase CobS
MIAEELKAIGFRPDNALTAETVKSIATDTALEVAAMVIEQLEQQGKLSQRSSVDIRINAMPVTTIEGKVPQWFPRLLKLEHCHVPALMVGPAGCGKTTSAAMVAKALDVPFYRLSMAAGVDEGCITGWLMPKQQMSFEYVYSMFTTAYEEGGLVLVDDIDLANANMLGILNAVLDKGDWFVPLRHENPRFEQHDKFYIMAAANTWGHGADRRFVGANVLDERTLSRFRLGQIRCDYDPELEKQLYSPCVTDWGHRIRNRCRAIEGWTRDVSTRDIETAHHLQQAMTPAETWYGYFADWSDDECLRLHANVDHAAMNVTLD